MDVKYFNIFLYNDAFGFISLYALAITINNSTSKDMPNPIPDIILIDFMFISASDIEKNEISK